MKSGYGFNASTASDDDIIAALFALYDRDVFSDTDHATFSRLCETILRTKVVATRQIDHARYKLRLYQKELDRINLDDFREDFTVQKAQPALSIKKSVELRCEIHDKENLRLYFPYEESLLLRVKAIKGRYFHNMGREKFWTVPWSPINIKALINLGFSIPKELNTTQKKYEGHLDFTGLKKELRPYQFQGVERAAGELDGVALFADEMGLGKTPQGLATVWVRKKDMFPCLVMCPGSLKWNWAKETHAWLPDVAVRILEGYPPQGRTQYRVRQKREITIINWEILADRGAKIGWGRLLRETGFKSAILDECQDIKNAKTKRTQAVIDVCNDMPYILALSGTPIESRPAEFYPILNLLVPDLFPSKWAFLTRYCGDQAEGFKGATNTQELNEILTDRVMIRRRKIDVLKDLPPKIRQVIPVGIDMDEYAREENALRSFLQESKGIDPQSRNAEGLARIERCKQAAARGKLQHAIDFIENYIVSGRKLVVFAVHLFIIDALEKHFSRQCVRLDGTTSGIKKQEAVDRFQGDASIKLIFATIKPGGRGHTLTAAADTLTLEFEWTPGKHDQAEDRVHRIGQEAEHVHALYMIAKGTIEEDIMELIDTKRSVLSQVLDGKEAEHTGMLKHLMNRYEKK